MIRHAYPVLVALAGWVGAATVVQAGDGSDLSALSGGAATVADDRLAEIAGREKRDDAEIELPRGEQTGDAFSLDDAEIIVPLGAQAGGTVASFAGSTLTAYGLPVVGARPGPTVGVAGVGIIGSAYRPNF